MLPPVPAQWNSPISNYRAPSCGATQIWSQIGFPSVQNPPSPVMLRWLRVWKPCNLNANVPSATYKHTRARCSSFLVSHSLKRLLLLMGWREECRSTENIPGNSGAQNWSLADTFFFYVARVMLVLFANTATAGTTSNQHKLTSKPTRRVCLFQKLRFYCSRWLKESNI